MKRLCSLLLTAMLLLSACFAVSVHAVVNDFTISDFQADYYLTRDSDNRSHLKTVEKITAEFPNIDQNHGIERALPLDYDGHPTHLKIVSVTDGQGNSLPYETRDSNGNKVLRIGDADRYVHGTQVYTLTYEQQDVTLRPSDKAVNEFYWDTNGTDWRVRFENITARVHLPASLATTLTSDAACYIGRQDSGEQCVITKTGDGDMTTLTIPSTRALDAGENVTFAIGFHEGTFSAYEPTLIDRLMAIWMMISGVLIAVSVGIILWLIYRFYKITERSKELGTIVPEYLPPRDASVTAASQVMSGPRSVMTAQLLDLAVRHYLKLYEVKEKSWFSPAEYEIEIIKDLSDLKWEEREIISDMFAGDTGVGQRLNLKQLRNSVAFATRTQNNDTGLTKLLRGEYALREKREPNVKWFRRAALILAVLGVLTFSLALLFAALVAFILSLTAWSLTDKGLELRRYLEGLKLYIGVAEQERIKMLQSPEGAVKVASIAQGTDPAQLVKLYERVLPYAVLFGQEKEWNKQLGGYYETAGAQPDWYSSGSGVYNAAVFASAMNNFSTSTGTYTSSSSSSSSGSGGGGSSGGGGGGGGGGGW